MNKSSMNVGEFSSGNRDIESWRKYYYLLKITLSRAGVLKILIWRSNRQKTWSKLASDDLKLDQAALDGWSAGLLASDGLKLDQAALDGWSAGLSASGGLKLDQAALDGWSAGLSASNVKVNTAKLL